MSQQPKKEKKLPVRRCVGCGEHKEKTALLRIVRTPEGEIVPDRTGKKNGRGAYLCPSSACLKKAVKTRALSRALETEIPDEVMQRLAAELEEDKDGQGA